MKISFGSQIIELTQTEKAYRAQSGDVHVEVKVVYNRDGLIGLLIDGHPVRAYVSSDGPRRWVTVSGRTYLLTKSSNAAHHAAGHEHSSELTAPMPGQVRSINAQVGERVKRGQTLLVLEAMKMEIRIQAPADGAVTDLPVRLGETVERDQLLAKMDYEAPKEKQ